MKNKLLLGLFLGLFSVAALAFQPFVIKDIRVEGLRRTEVGTVFSYLPVKVGDTMTEEKATQAIKALFATGFFRDVRIEVQGNVLIVVIQERPEIAKVEFSGIKEFDKDALTKGLKDVGLAEARIFDRSLLDRAVQELKREYLSRGHYAVHITTTVTPLERNRVAINFAVDEGQIAKIRQITIVGARSFKEKDLLDLFQLRTPGWFTWYTKNDQYSKQKLAADIETLRSYYLDRGFAEFTVDSTQVQISPDKQSIYITINVTEGPRYTVSSVKLAGNLLLPVAELRKLVTIKPGQVFSREKLTDTTKAIADQLGNEGYAFANVNAAPELDKVHHKVAFTIYIDPGSRVYVRRVNITGNTRTRDEVIRREMRQLEGAWYDAAKIKRSRTRIDKLGDFEDVTVQTPPVPGTTDQVDVDVKVKEKPTGNILAGVGFSSSEGLVFTGAVTQNNLFGSGKNVGVQLNTGSINKTISFSYTNPYYTIDGISAGFDVYKRNVDPTSLSLGDYQTSTLGGGVRIGFPISEENFINFGLVAESTKVTTYSDSPPTYIDFVNTFGHSNTSLQANVSWASDSRDSYLYPTKGSYKRAFFEASVPPGSLRYYRASYQQQRYFPIGRKYSLMLNGEVSYGRGMGGKPLPFFKNFYAGGIGSVRGYETASLGPVDANGNRFGGNRSLVANAEFFMPFPGAGLSKAVRMSLFVDAGQVWGVGQKASLSDLRYSTGLGVYWSSPLGPLNFSIAFPIKKGPEDKVQRFQFQFGSSF